MDDKQPCGEWRASELKILADEAASKNDLNHAIDLYSQAIGLKRDDSILYASRAVAYIKLYDYQNSEKDCIRSIEINNQFSQPYYILHTIYSI